MYLYTFLKFLHLAGLSVGYGGVLIGAWLSARSLKDNDFFKAVAKIMPAISLLIWIALILLAVSGIFLEDFWQVQRINFGGKYPLLLIKEIIVVLIVIHGIYVHLYLSRKMAQLAGTENPFAEPDFKRFKILGTISAIISLTLWTAAVVLGIWISSKMILF